MAQKYVPAALRRLVRARAGERCEYCLIPEQLTLAPHWVDHVVAEKHGGHTEEANLALSGVPCNNYKGDRISGFDPETAETVPLFNPRTQNRFEHFRWSDDGVRVIGLTACGRATVKALHLSDDPNALMVRSYWVRDGWHPPTE